MNRRGWIRTTIGATVLPAVAGESAGATVRQSMPVLAKHEGGWQGTYTFVDPRGKQLDQYEFDIKVMLSASDERAYRQETQYRWPDGKTENRVFEAQHESGQLVWDNGRIAGRMQQIDSRTLYLHFKFAAMPGIECFEMIQISENGEHRGRSWLWYRDGALYQSVLIDERRS